MRKQIITTVAAVAILSTAAFAMGKQGCDVYHKSQGQNVVQMKKMHHVKMNHGKRMQHKNIYAMKFFNVIGQLNLSLEQKTSIRDIMKTPMKKQESMYSAFSETSFDKEKFIQQVTDKRESMLKSKAEKIEKVYNVLTKKQKKQLRVLMDLQEEKGMSCDKNCNGRG